MDTGRWKTLLKCPFLNFLPEDKTTGYESGPESFRRYSEGHFANQAMCDWQQKGHDPSNMKPKQKLVTPTPCVTQTPPDIQKEI